MRTVTVKRLDKQIGVKKNKVSKLLGQISDAASLEARMDRASRSLLGTPYVENPLGGGPNTRERLQTSLEGFDCVTFIETALALATSKKADTFRENLQSLRYRDGNVDWFDRNHYMVDWITNNKRRSAISDLTRGDQAVARVRVVNVVPGLEARRVTFNCFPKRTIGRIKDRIRTGDLIMFVSAKNNLDVFHTGVLIRQKDRLLLRHATRSKGRVVEQDLRDFLKKHRMSGFMIARPLCPR